jgi:hypothetical protein
VTGARFRRTRPGTTFGTAFGAAILAVSTVGAAASARAAAVGETAPVAGPQSRGDMNAPYDGLWHFVRLQYDARSGDVGGGGFGFGRSRREAMWAHDYPRAELNFMKIIKDMTLVPALGDGSNVYALDDPDLFMYPAAYIVEPGFWFPTDEEARSLGDYLRKGGFLVVDDFRGDSELANLQAQLERVLPEGRMVLVEETNEIFDAFFRIAPHEVVPPYGGLPPIWYGIYEDNDPSKPLQVIINHNNDMAEYWEYSDFGYYPIDLSNEAYKLGVNYVVYALTH